jgi:hypothetical protein
VRTPTRCAWCPTRSSPSASAPVKRAVLDPVAKRHHAPHPQALLLRGGDLIADLRVREIIDNGVDLGFDVHIEPMRQRYLAASILVPTSESQNTCTLKPCALRGMVMPDAYHNCSYNSANPTSAGRTSATTTKSRRRSNRRRSPGRRELAERELDLLWARIAALLSGFRSERRRDMVDIALHDECTFRGEPSVGSGPRATSFFDRVRATSLLPLAARSVQAASQDRLTTPSAASSSADPMNQAARAARGAGAPRALTRA